MTERIAVRTRFQFALCVVLFALAYKVHSRWTLSESERTASYGRYASLGAAAVVKELVDRHHDEAFGRCYQMALGRAVWDAECYRDAMNAAVLPGARALGLATLEPKPSEAPGAEAPRETYIFTPPTAAPSPTKPAVEILSINVRAATTAEWKPMNGRQYLVDVLVADAAGAIHADTPPPYRLGILCPSLGFVEQPGKRAESAHRDDGGQAHVLLRAAVPTRARPNQRCELFVSIADPAGQRSEEKSREFFVE
jgi:hypothetical protein